MKVYNCICRCERSILSLNDWSLGHDDAQIVDTMPQSRHSRRDIVPMFLFRSSGNSSYRRILLSPRDAERERCNIVFRESERWNSLPSRDTPSLSPYLRFPVSSLTLWQIYLTRDMIFDNRWNISPARRDAVFSRFFLHPPVCETFRIRVQKFFLLKLRS